jgi:hypothetical protein
MNKNIPKVIGEGSYGCVHKPSLECSSGNINYKDNDGIDLVSPISTKYVVYNINYTKSLGGPEMTVYLSEV